MTEFHFGGGHRASHEPQACRGRPFQADFEELHFRQSTQESASAFGKLYRDSQGRRRRDVTERTSDASHGHQFAVVEDPVAGECYVLDPTSKTVSTVPLNPDELKALGAMTSPLSCLREGTAGSPWQPTTWREERLETKFIEGVLCEGRLKTSEAGEIRELWSSHDLAETILEKKSSPEGEISYRLFNIRREELDAALFLPPGI
ncbi:MAG: hypothetical protein AB1898_24245 [Acidobacteriota bacterium]